MAASTASRVTTNHEEIRRWAATRCGTPAVIVRPKSSDDDAGHICIYFPHNRNEGALDEISWEDWFKKFDAAKLALLYQENTAGGERSNFNKLVSRQTVDEVEEAVGGKGRSASRRKSRRSAGVDAFTPLRDDKLQDDKPQRNATRSRGPRKVSKKSTATVASGPSRKKKPPLGKASRDKSS